MTDHVDVVVDARVVDYVAFGCGGMRYGRETGCDGRTNGGIR